jgi:hypothetical protein
MRNLILCGLLPLALAGCGTAGAIVGVATAPIKVASKAADLATTSQSESDEKRGREMRRREARIDTLDRAYRRQSEKCTSGDAQACARRDAAYEALLSMP